MAKAAKPKAPAGRVTKSKSAITKTVKAKSPAEKTAKAKPKPKVKKSEPELDEAGITDTLYGLTLAVLGIAEFVADRIPGLADHLEEMLARRSPSSGTHVNFPRGIVAELRKKRPSRRTTQVQE